MAEEVSDGITRTVADVQRVTYKMSELQVRKALIAYMEDAVGSVFNETTTVKIRRNADAVIATEYLSPVKTQGEQP